MRQSKNNMLFTTGLAVVAVISIWPVSLSAKALQKNGAEEQDQPPSANETPITNDADAAAGARVYSPQDFAQYAPRNAYDMVIRIPGFSVDFGEQGDRGLGQATQNVLINGARVSGKSNDTVGTLQRISAERVQRIEVLDGATLDIPGLSGEVANIIYESTGQVGGQFFYGFQNRPNIEDTIFNGSASINGGSDNSKWSVGISNQSFRNGNYGPEIRYDRNRNIIRYSDELGRFNGDRPRINGSYSRTAANGNEFNINAAGELYFFRGHNDNEVELADGTFFIEDGDNGEDEWNAELGADYAFNLGGGRLKLIGLQRNEDSEFYSTFGRVGEDFSRYEQEVFESESILRGEYGWKSGQVDWEVSLEGAYNLLSSESRLIDLPVGEPESITPFPNADINEQRAEAFVSYSRPLTSSLSLQLNIGGEYSRISVEGVEESRSYLRPKGALALSWRADKDLTVDAKFSRIVDQLNFFDFLSQVDIQNNGTDRARNNTIVPPQRWRARLEATQKLGEYGSITPHIQYEWIEDPLEIIPIDDETSALGNVESASHYFAGIDGSLLFAPMGLKGLRLDIHAHVNDSRIRDPLLGNYRGLNNSNLYHFNFNLRHDIPKTDLAWGLDYQHSRGEPYVRLNQVTRGFSSKHALNAFVEHKDVFGLTVKAGLYNLLGSQDSSRRKVYVDRRDGPISYYEEGDKSYGTILTIDVTGDF